MTLEEAYLELKIIQDLVPAGNSNRPGTRMHASSITIHNTDNDGRGANAAAHAKYMKGADAQKRQVSWHFTVDDKLVYQSIPTNEVAWHAASRQGNASSIGIEICMNPELDVPKTYDRAALLVAVIAHRGGIHIPEALFQHHDWSGKDCPRILRHKPNGWQDFVDAVSRKLRTLTPTEVAELSVSDDDHDHHRAGVASRRSRA